MGTIHVLLIRIEESQWNKLILTPYYKQRNVLLSLLVCCDMTGLSSTGFQFVLFFSTILRSRFFIVCWADANLHLDLLQSHVPHACKLVSWTSWALPFCFTILVAAQWDLPGCPVTGIQTLKLSYYRCLPAHGLYQHHLKPLQDSISSLSYYSWSNPWQLGGGFVHSESRDIIIHCQHFTPQWDIITCIQKWRGSM